MATNSSFLCAKKALFRDLELLEESIRNVRLILNDNENVNGGTPVQIFEAMKQMRDRMSDVNTPADLSHMRRGGVPGSSQIVENEILKMAY